MVNLGGCFSAQELNRAEQTVSVPGRNEGTGKPTAIPVIRRDRFGVARCLCYLPGNAEPQLGFMEIQFNTPGRRLAFPVEGRIRGTCNELRYYEQWRKKKGDTDEPPVLLF